MITQNSGDLTVAALHTHLKLPGYLFVGIHWRGDKKQQQQKQNKKKHTTNNSQTFVWRCPTLGKCNDYHDKPKAPNKVIREKKRDKLTNKGNPVVILRHQKV